VQINALQIKFIRSKKKGVIMKKALMMLIITLFLLATVGNVFGEEIAKDGLESGKNYVTGTAKALPMALVWAL
jgi:hypothetical protein